LAQCWRVSLWLHFVNEALNSMLRSDDLDSKHILAHSLIKLKQGRGQEGSKGRLIEEG
jgi:hypothetical protein